MPSKRNVVVVGGGGAGAALARTLSQKLDSTAYNLILVSAHPYFIHYVAGLRTLVTTEGSLEKQMLIPYNKLFVNDNGRFQQGTVTAIEAEKDAVNGGKVVLESGDTIYYHVLVLAAGSKWESMLDFPYDGEKVQTHIDQWRDKFRDAKKIVIAGGGAVGIELSGELRDSYPDKEITIVQGDKKLLNKTYPDKFRLDMERRVRAHKVHLILDDHIDSLTASTTRKGVQLDADLIVSARGPRPNTSFIASSLGKEVINDEGFVHIRPTMQLAEYPSIFAMGDIIDFPEQKQVGKYGGHASVVAQNVLSLLSGAQPKKEYKGTVEAIFVTLGKSAGAGFIGILWGLMFGNWVVPFVKSKGLFISMTRKSLGQSS